jgi:hypothetical protein
MRGLGQDDSGLGSTIGWVVAGVGVLVFYEIFLAPSTRLKGRR